MSQLKLYKTLTEPCEFPTDLGGFEYRSYNGSVEDRAAWAEICKNGLVGDDADDTRFIDVIEGADGYKPENVFFITENGNPVATITALVQENGRGWVHMVSVHKDSRGKGLGAYLNQIALAALSKANCTYVGLTTDEFRVPAVKSYLRAGFRPVLYEEDMEARWLFWLNRYGYMNIDCYDNDNKFVKNLCTVEKKDKLKVGVFGLRRGTAIAEPAVLSEKGYIHAVCDYDETTYELVEKCTCEDTKYFKDFDEFIESGLDVVILANYFHEHAKFAIKALEKGIHVYSETLPAVTLADCVKLCRAAEKSNAKYMIAENCAYFGTVRKMEEIYKNKTLGGAVYCEGEYVHPMPHDGYKVITPDAKHWRALMPSGYYSTHALAPIMQITGEVPVAVNALSIYSDEVRIEREEEPTKDVASIMLCTMSDGSIARVTGWCKFGGHGLWYRMNCGKGSLESVRGDDYKVRLFYNDWEIPEGMEQETFYDAEYPFDKDRASQSGHFGGDYYAIYDFLDCVQNDREPFLDVYKSATMTATAIFGWRSSLNDGIQYEIPDFRNEAERAVYENDTWSPFPDENGETNFPCTKYQLGDFNIEF